MSQTPKPILIDTCVLLMDPGVVSRIRDKGGFPFLPSTILDELDLISKKTEAINENARYISCELKKAPSTKVGNLPTGRKLQGNDTLARFLFDGGPLFLINRHSFKYQAANDSGLIDLARDYEMLLLTGDIKIRNHAEAAGVSAVLWSGPQGPDNRPISEQEHLTTTNSNPAAREVEPFDLPLSPTTEKDQTLPVSLLPKDGDVIILSSGKKLTLKIPISAGGEGTIYLTTDSHYVCKVYHPDKLSLLRKKKIELMVSRKIRRLGLCWPSEIAMNDRAEFVGYLMPRATGKTLQSSLFVKPVLEKTFPLWGRQDLVNICLAFLEHIRYLHSLNIIVGDINPMNLLVTEDSSKLWIVDADSFQIEGFPCPVGTVNFTAPEIQGRNYAEFLRTKEHELFSVATMVFMLLHPGKPPYSQQGGGSPAANIKAMDFPYPFRKDGDEHGGRNVPHGPWQLIWFNLPFHIKEALHRTFRENDRLSVDEWINAMKRYHGLLLNNQTASDLFPTSFFRVRDPVEVCCDKCGNSYIESQRWVNKMKLRNRPLWCHECTKHSRLERLARDSAHSVQYQTKTNHSRRTDCVTCTKCGTLFSSSTSRQWIDECAQPYFLEEWLLHGSNPYCRDCFDHIHLDWLLGSSPRPNFRS